MQTELRQDEQVVKEGRATLQKLLAAAAGKLFLTNQRLVFESKDVSNDTGAIEVELPNVQSARPCWTKAMGLGPLFPNSVAVVTEQGEDFRYIVYGRRKWAAAIEEQRKA